MRRFVVGAAVCAVAAAVACGGDSSGPSIRAASVTGIAGDSQIGPTGAQLQVPLSFVVLDASGLPQEGVPITWTVAPAGRATFNPQSSTSDALGNVSTTVTLGSTFGQITISATVAGLAQPVAFNVVIVDPCEWVTEMAIGDVASGALASGDCLVQSAFYTDYFVFDVPAQQALRLSQSATFDTYLELYDVAGPGIGFNDDSGFGSTNSRIEAILAPGGYLLAPSSFNAFATGPYTVGIETRAATLQGCEFIWGSPGITLTEVLEQTDCVEVDTTGAEVDTTFADQIALYLVPGTVLNVSQTSTAFEARVRIFYAGAMQAQDSAGAGTEAAIAYTVTTAGVHFVVPGSAPEKTTGSYTLSITATPAPSSPNARATARRMLFPAGKGPLPGMRRRY